MKGIVLAGGSGSRLHPITLGISKQLIPINGLPMVYFPISVLMRAGIRDILIITTPSDQPNFKNLLGDGSIYGCHFEYAKQPEPNGLAQAFIIGEKFINNDSVCLILGDNLFIGDGLEELLLKAVRNAEEELSTVFGYWVEDPKSFGVAEIDEESNCVSIEEKPENPKSNYAVIGLYFYPNAVVNIAKGIKPSKRGEYEITTVNQQFLKKKLLKLLCIDKNIRWYDTGTFDDLIEASETVKKYGYSVACLEKIALRNGWINRDDVEKRADGLKNSYYGQYLSKLLKLI
jgi:glucose-1-phosphate thymidylyltransferase